MSKARQRLGSSGESLTALWYEDRGYRVLARNWRGRAGELDLVARRGLLVAFCEVKTRATAAFGSPAAAVGPAKQERIRRLAAEFLDAHPQPGALDHRFDVAAVIGDDVELIEAAF